MLRLTVMLVACAFVLINPTVAAAAGTAAEDRHSGTVVAVDTQAGTVTLEEIGQGTSSGTNRVIRRTVHLTPGSHVVLVSRGSRDASHLEPGQWPGGYQESELNPANIETGDFVTVVLGKEGGQQVAESVSVVRANTESASPATGK